jgi:hypothetical protein
LHYLTQLKDDDLSRLAEDARQLALGSIKLEHGPISFSEHSAHAIAAACPRLTTLSIGDSSVTDGGLAEMTSRCPAISTVALRHCHAITDVGVYAIAQGCPQLTTLQVHNLEKITDAGLVAIAARCPHLCSVDVSRAQVGDATMAALGQWSPHLKSLDISWCVNVSDKGVIAIANGCRGLKEFNYKGCRKLTPESITEVASRCPALAHLRMETPAGFMGSVPEPTSRVCRNARGLCDGWFSSCTFGC